jgi:hypothetical protein
MPKAPDRSSLKVLFIGNSFTARNDLPGLVARLAETQKFHLEHQLINVGGASLRMHWNKGDAQKAIDRGCFDYAGCALRNSVRVTCALSLCSGRTYPGRWPLAPKPAAASSSLA